MTPMRVPVLRSTARPGPAARYGLLALRLALLAGLVAVAARVIRPADLATLGRFLRDEPAPALAAVAAYAAAFALRAWAWQVLLPPGGRRPPFLLLWRLTLAANLVNHLAPGKLGEVARIALAARAGLPRAEALVSVVQARAVDTAALLAVAAAALFLSPAQAAAVPAVALGLAVPVGLAAGARLSPRLARRWPRLAPVAGALAAVSGRRLALAWLLSALSWPLEAGILVVVARGLGAPLDPAAALTATLVAVAGQVLAITPGGLGTYEANMTLALQLYAVEPAAAFRIALATHLAKYLFAFAAGLEPAWRLAGGPIRLLGRLRE
ncbi:lysylphosphatidylglycerol synthase transmembrane domain-containing protein [Thermaerobacter subterraneus]|nr:lysylphosphatidylglycerol synthase transmembrane domain-containing protein [Thermaerobacter subterraneus]